MSSNYDRIMGASGISKIYEHSLLYLIAFSLPGSSIANNVISAKNKEIKLVLKVGELF